MLSQYFSYLLILMVGRNRLLQAGERILCICVFKNIYEHMRTVELGFERKNWPILDDWAVERVQ